MSWYFVYYLNNVVFRREHHNPDRRCIKIHLRLTYIMASCIWIFISPLLIIQLISSRIKVEEMKRSILIWIFYIFILILIKIINGEVLKREFKSNSFESLDKLKVMAKIQSPFIMFDSKSGYITGIDVLLLRTIAKKLNLNLEYTIVDNLTVDAESHWEYVFLTLFKINLFINPIFSTENMI